MKKLTKKQQATRRANIEKLTKKVARCKEHYINVEHGEGPGAIMLKLMGREYGVLVKSSHSCYRHHAGYILQGPIRQVKKFRKDYVGDAISLS